MLLKEKVNMRHCFVAPEGYVWASCDFSAQEHRNAGAVARDKNITAIYKLERDYKLGLIQKPVDLNGKEYDDPRVDPHIMAATSMHPEVKRLVEEEPWNAHKKHPLIAEFRQKGKILNYCLVYGGQANSIAGQLSCPVEEAQSLIDAYFSEPDGFYGLGAWLKTTAAMAAERRWVRTPLNGMLYVNESNAKGLADQNTVMRKACNSVIQGLGAEQAKLALIRAQKRIDALNFKYRGAVLNGREGRINSIIHDECNGTVPGSCEMVSLPNPEKGLIKYDVKLDLTDPEHALAFEYGEAIRLSMEEAQQETFDLLEVDLPAAAELTIGKYWIH